MLKQIHIQGFKSLADVEIRPEPLTVLLGPNASGKSNFLDALHVLSRMARADSLADAFTPPYRGGIYESFSFGEEGIPGLLEREAATFSVELDIELSPSVVASVEKELQDARRLNGEQSGPARL